METTSTTALHKKMLWEHSLRAYYVRNSLLNIIGNDREYKKQQIENSVFLVPSKIAYKFQFSTTVSSAVKQSMKVSSLLKQLIFCCPVEPVQPL